MSNHLQKAAAAISVYRSLSANNGTQDPTMEARLAALGDVVEALLELAQEHEQRSLATIEPAPEPAMAPALES